MSTLDPLKASARKDRILDAATAVFAEKGFHQATVKAIAKLAGVADGTIYNHFENKEALLIGLLDRLNETDRRAEHFAQAENTDFRAFFVSYLRRRFALLWPNARVFQAVLPELIANPKLKTLYRHTLLAPTMAVGERYLETLIAQGELEPIDVPLAVRTFAATFFGLLFLEMLDDEPLSARSDELPELLARMFLDGLGKERDHA